MAESISIEANELLECFQWSENEVELEYVEEELADAIVYCYNVLDVLELDVDEIMNEKKEMDVKKWRVDVDGD